MISVVLATHNEEKNLKMCLSSVKDFADQIVIVDGESTDDTVKIAKHFSAEVISTTNKSNFHINKQLAMDKAKGDLILQLDADEVVDEELKKFIIKTHSWVLEVKKTVGLSASKRIENPSKVYLPSAWWIQRKNCFLGKFLTKGGQYPDPVIRMYLYGQAKLPQKDVHEQMVVQGNISWAEGHLLHYSNPTFNDYVRKWNTYTSFRTEEFKAQKLQINFTETLRFLFFKPVYTFSSLFIRHRGYVDGVSGFIFALMSGFHFAVAYLKYWEIIQKK